MRREDLEPGVETQTKRFAALFSGREDAFGLDRGAVAKKPLTEMYYRRHLTGVLGIGVFPVRDDNTVKFAAIDLDEPDFDLAVEMAKLLPGHVWIERSRSGNAHVWTFFREACPAWAARAVLRATTLAVGRPEVEVFPKQSELREGMVGNYINLCYHNGTRPMVWQTGDDRPSEGYSLNAFLHDAERVLNDSEEWIRRARAIGAEPPGKRENSEFGTRATPHICAQYMLENKDSNPLQPGCRHVVLFNLAKQLANTEGWTESDVLLAVESFNEAGVEPLGHHEVEQTVQNAIAGRFTSTGCDEPLMSDYVSKECKIAFPK